MPLLLDHPCCTVIAEPVKGILRFVRTEVPYGSTDELLEVHRHVGGIFDRVGRDRHLLLVDYRRAALNNEPGFERVSARARAILTQGFGRIAVLVQTAVGALQVGRHIREDRLPGEVFTDETQALEYLRQFEREPGPPSSLAGRDAGRDGPFGHLWSLGRTASARSRRW
jgi:hypothetical protein